VAYFKAFAQYMPGGTGENHENLKSEYRFSGPRPELGAFRT